MKKNKLKTLIASAQKDARKRIETSLVAELTKLFIDSEQDSKKLTSEIRKGSKQLAKRISKKIKIDKSSIIEASKTKHDSTDVVKSPVTTPGKSKVIISNSSVGNKPIKTATAKSAGVEPTAKAANPKEVQAEDVTTGIS